MGGNIVIEVVCPNCRQSRRIYKSNMKKSGHTGYCRACFEKLLRPRGEASPHWKGGRGLAQKRWNSRESTKETKRLYYLATQEHRRARGVERRARLKVEVLTHYGGGKLVCVRCGFIDVRALTIDHIEGGGSGHRRSIGIGTGEKFYRWLKGNGFPLGYQTLCWNCQAVKKMENNE